MKIVVLLHFAQYLLTSVLTETADDVHRIWYTTNDDLDTSDDVIHEDSNIIEVRVLPDPDFVPPSFINHDRQGFSNDDSKTVYDFNPTKGSANGIDSSPTLSLISMLPSQSN